MGWQVDPNDASAIKQDTVSALRVMTTENMTYPPEATKSARISGIIDKNDTNVNAAAGKIMNLEFYDNQGYKYTAKLSVHSTKDDGKFTVKLDDILDSKGKTVLPDKAKASLQQNNADVTDPVLEFDLKNGSFKNVGTAGGTESTLTLHFDTGTFPSFTDITIDFSKCSNLNNNGSSTVSPIRGDAKGNGAGRKVGEMSGIEIQKDGMIYANYDNGCSRLLGQIAVATFANASGLAKEGDNLYSATQNSGDFDGIGTDITTGGGYMNTGVLEMSNVDLSSEFTEMITTQRGFQANSRIITVSDTLLEELTNLKR